MSLLLLLLSDVIAVLHMYGNIYLNFFIDIFKIPTFPVIHIHCLALKSIKLHKPQNQ